MASIQSNLDRLEFQSGVDVTRKTGKHERAIERLREAKAAVEDIQSIESFRAYVAAYDDLFGSIGDAAKWADVA